MKWANCWTQVSYQALPQLLWLPGWNPKVIMSLIKKTIEQSTETKDKYIYSYNYTYQNKRLCALTGTSKDVLEIVSGRLQNSWTFKDNFQLLKERLIESTFEVQDGLSYPKILLLVSFWNSSQLERFSTTIMWVVGRPSFPQIFYLFLFVNKNNSFL